MQGFPGATEGASPLGARRRRITIGAAADPSNSSSRAETTAARRRGGDRRGHDGKRLVRPALPVAQPPDRGFVPGVDQQLESADPLQRHDPALAQVTCGQGQGAVALRHHGSGCIPKRDLRSTPRAGVGLGVKPAVERIVIFGLALRAHPENPHGGVDPVVGEAFDQAEARPAVRAVGERVAVAPVPRIEDLAPAIGASREVGQDERGFRAALPGRSDGEKAGGPARSPEGDLDLVDLGGGRLIRLQSAQEAAKRRPIAYEFDFDPLGGIAHAAPKGQFGCEPVNKGSEAHSLDGAAHGDPRASRAGVGG